METVKDFRHMVEDTIDDMEAQYPQQTPFCEVLHFELGLPQTRVDNADELLEQLREKKVNITEDSVKLTKEHTELHRALNRVVLGVMSESGDASQLAAQMIAVGRRMGLREAAGLLP